MPKEFDFSRARRAKDTPHLAKLQAEAKGKTRVTIMLDNFVIEAFRELAKAEGIGYQTLINRTLREQLTSQRLSEDDLRRVIREELAANVARNHL